MFFDLGLYLSLGICLAGTAYRVFAWFTKAFPGDSRIYRGRERLLAAAGGIARTLCSARILKLGRALVLDAILLLRVWREDKYRWLMHQLMFLGFVLLLLMHALEGLVSEQLFAAYYSTANPFLFLRNLFGLMVLAGVGLAGYRRLRLRRRHLVTTRADVYALAIVGLIVLSGFGLEAVKITSPAIFQDMVDVYGGLSDEEELRALQSYWVASYGLVIPGVEGPFSAEELQVGRDLHDMSCAECHSRPQWAVGSYGLSRLLKPVAPALDRAAAPQVLWYVHLLAAFVGLALLPFTKMFHLVTGPLSLLVNAVMDPERSHPANVVTRQFLELDACTHCCTCTMACSVGVVTEVIPNLNILPAAKLQNLRKLPPAADLGAKQLRELQEGLYLCTNCMRCTNVCPVGINLQELWFAVREIMVQQPEPQLLLLTPLSLYRGLYREQIPAYEEPLIRTLRWLGIDGTREAAGRPLVVAAGNAKRSAILERSVQAQNFRSCYRCATCSNACPVVKNYVDAGAALDLLPHQIMHALGLGLWEEVFASRMLWACLGCYQCQEYCPQGVAVTDVLYELKNQAFDANRRRQSEPEE